MAKGKLTPRKKKGIPPPKGGKKIEPESGKNLPPWLKNKKS